MISLEDFVAEALTQLVAGVQKAQAETKETGAEINPDSIAANKHAVQVILERGGGIIERIEFDIAVTTNDKSGSKAGLGVFSGFFGVGGQVEDSAENQSTNRIKFSVPVKFPVSR